MEIFESQLSGVRVVEPSQERLWPENRVARELVSK
jgi:hypothetical protein